MEQKMIPKYEYLGLGFPVMLKNVVFLKFMNNGTPRLMLKKSQTLLFIIFSKRLQVHI